MCVIKRVKTAVIVLLFGSGTEWHEASMAVILYSYCLWVSLYGHGILMPMKTMTAIMPPYAWAVWFGSAAMMKTIGLLLVNARFRIWGSWMGTITWALLFAQFLFIEPTIRLGLPTFAALTLTNGWLVLRNALLMEKEKRDGGPCKPSTL